MGSKLEYFDELMLEEPEDLGYKHLDSALREIASGISSFGRWEEWVIWFRYLLPKMITWKGERLNTIIEATITAFMNVYWDGVADEYPEFREDVLNSLAKVIMTPPLWGSIQDFPYLQGGYIWEINNTLTASMFFCLKFLKTEEIRTWIASFVAIEDVRWRLQIIIWLTKAKQFFKDSQYTFREPLDKKLRKYELDWQNIESLTRINNFLTEFISIENQQEFWSALKENLTEDLFLRWLDDFYMQEPVLAKQIDDWGIFDQLFDKTLSQS